MAKASKILKGELRRAIREEGGNISRVATRFDVSRQTVYNRVEALNLWPEVEVYRRMMFRMAEDNLLGAVEEGDIETSKFVVTRYPGVDRWGTKTEVVGAVKLSPETLRQLEAMGADPEELREQLEQIVAAMHAEKMSDGNDDE